MVPDYHARPTPARTKDISRLSGKAALKMKKYGPPYVFFKCRPTQFIRQGKVPFLGSFREH
jgi:hypothetical protein